MDGHITIREKSVLQMSKIKLQAGVLTGEFVNSCNRMSSCGGLGAYISNDTPSGFLYCQFK